MNKHVTIQSMTSTDTADVQKTAQQIIELADAGSEMVRMTVDNEDSAQAIPKIKKILEGKGYGDLPLIGDFHFNGHRLLNDFPDCAQTLDKYRINPGNVGYGKRHDENFETIIKIAIKNKKMIRIGGNSGSIDPELLKKMKGKKIETLVKGVIDSAKYAEKLGLKQNKIFLSVKMSDLQNMVKAYRLLAKKTKAHPYKIHLGLTEAGAGMQGVISSSAALAILLEEGIGDTIRISLTPEPNESRSKEVAAARILLQSLGLRHFRPQVTSCPGCGRTNSTLFRTIAQKVNDYIDKNRITTPIKIAVMGCVVNGPGESKGADIGISLPGKNEKNIAQVYIKGKLTKTLTGKNLDQQFLGILKPYLSENPGINKIREF
jgi:(E)-4-hydroxy-3-methylbut-2-enyl-diphosphate synthase